MYYIIRTATYARHYQQFFNKDKYVPNPAELRELSTFKILWRGNMISMMKTFGTNWCKLCMKERIEILKRTYKDPTKIINSCNEIYGACKHKANFHRYQENEQPRGHLATAWWAENAKRVLIKFLRTYVRVQENLSLKIYWNFMQANTYVQNNCISFVWFWNIFLPNLSVKLSA